MIQSQSTHVSLAELLEVARSFTVVPVGSQTTQPPSINTSGCAAPHGTRDFATVWAPHPASIGLTCNSADVLVGARWRGWGRPPARATAVLAVDDCNPSCAQRSGPPLPGDGRRNAPADVCDNAASTRA